MKNVAPEYSQYSGAVCQSSHSKTGTIDMIKFNPEYRTEQSYKTTAATERPTWPRRLATHIKRKPVLGTFTKAIPGAIAINFGLSGGKNCQRSCKHHWQSTAKHATRACYASMIEYKRGSVRNKLAVLEETPASYVCDRAIQEIDALETMGQQIPWARISTNGSVPNAYHITPRFVDRFRALLSRLIERGAPIHLPVESASKAQVYRKLVGDLVCVRESAQTDHRFIHANGPVSTSGGERGDKLRERIAKSRELCRKRTEATGRRAYVCPAILATFRLKLRERSRTAPKPHCGKCTLCADSRVDIVYPLHS